jgi:hypothetical protein
MNTQSNQIAPTLTVDPQTGYVREARCGKHHGGNDRVSPVRVSGGDATVYECAGCHEFHRAPCGPLPLENTAGLVVRHG